MKKLVILCCCFGFFLSAEEFTGVVSGDKRHVYLTCKDNVKYRLTGDPWRKQAKELIGKKIVVSGKMRQEKSGKALKLITSLKLIDDKKSTEEKSVPTEDEYESDF